MRYAPTNRVVRHRTNLAFGLSLVAIVVTVALSVGFYLTTVELFGTAAGERARLDRALTDIESALCVLRTDAEARRDQAKAFLEDFPAGVPGIPLAILDQSIENYESTIEALESLMCAAPR